MSQRDAIEWKKIGLINSGIENHVYILFGYYFVFS